MRIPRLSEIKNMFFPGVPGDNSSVWNQGVQVPVMANDAKKLSRYHAPVQLNRLRIDLKYWRSSITEAERPLSSLPYRVQMQTIFVDTIQNGHVFACMQKRKNLTLLKDYHICDKNGKTNEVATLLIKKKWFTLGLNYILDAKFYGYSLITFGDLIDGNFPDLTICRRWEVSPDREVLSTQPYIPTGILFNRPGEVDPNGVSYYDWSLYVDTPSENGVSKCGYGLLYKVALYEIILRNLIGWNSTYAELFGQPIRVGKTDKDSEDAGRKAFEQSLDKMGSEAWILMDTLDQLELLFPTGTGTGNDVYSNLEQRFEKIISSIILGHKDAISSTPGKLGSEQGKHDSPVNKALDEVEATDTRDIEAIVNDIWIPKLIKLGFNIPAGQEFRFKNDSEQDDIRKNTDANNKAFADVLQTLKNAGFEPEEDYVAQVTGIPVKKKEEPEPQEEEGFNMKIKNKLLKTYGSSTGIK